MESSCRFDRFSWVGGLLLALMSAGGALSCSKDPSHRERDVRSARAPDSTAALKDWLVGEWTALPEQPGVKIQPGYWEYLRFNSDGTVWSCSALGSDDRWDCSNQFNGGERAVPYEVLTEREPVWGKDVRHVKVGKSLARYVPRDTVIEQFVSRDGGISYERTVDFIRGNRHPHAPTPRQVAVSQTGRTRCMTPAVVQTLVENTPGEPRPTNIVVRELEGCVRAVGYDRGEVEGVALRYRLQGIFSDDSVRFVQTRLRFPPAIERDESGCWSKPAIELYEIGDVPAPLESQSFRADRVEGCVYRVSYRSGRGLVDEMADYSGPKKKWLRVFSFVGEPPDCYSTRGLIDDCDVTPDGEMVKSSPKSGAKRPGRN